MKALILLLCFGLSTLTAQARSDLRCSAADKGWEEHFGGHRTCGECLQKHGKCVETCSLDYYDCEAQGRDSRGASIVVSGSGEDRFEAERNALRRCDRYFTGCSVSSCSSKSQTVSRKDCQ